MAMYSAFCAVVGRQPTEDVTVLVPSGDVSRRRCPPDVKLQNNVHNKGIVVDGKLALVSSQNWSVDGSLYNRDARPDHRPPDAATYFANIFTHDCNHLAHQRAAED